MTALAQEHALHTTALAPVRVHCEPHAAAGVTPSTYPRETPEDGAAAVRAPCLRCDAPATWEGLCDEHALDATMGDGVEPCGCFDFCSCPGGV